MFTKYLLLISSWCSCCSFHIDDRPDLHPAPPYSVLTPPVRGRRLLPCDSSRDINKAHTGRFTQTLLSAFQIYRLIPLISLSLFLSSSLSLSLFRTNQVYLVEEDQANRRARKKAGGNSGKRYTEGWVEFEDKKIARGQYNVLYECRGIPRTSSRRL